MIIPHPKNRVTRILHLEPESEKDRQALEALSGMGRDSVSLDMLHFEKVPSDG